jgi:hypothetical protein
MPDYLLLLIGEETEADDPESEAFWDEVARYEHFETLAGDAIVDGHALEPSHRGMTVRADATGSPVVTDGPYAETIEVVGGLFVLRVDDLDAVIELARHIPAAFTGAVEIRPMVEHWQPARDRPPGTRRYIALLRGEESAASDPSTEGWDRGAAAHDAFGRRHATALLSGAALHPSTSATTLRVCGGQLLLTDGPVEGSEVVGGYYLLCAASREEAAAVMADVPLGPAGIVELRPRVESGGP